VVAINKIDKPGANIEQTKQSLAEHEIYLEGYGGDIPWSAISAKKGDGVPELLELIDLVAEINNVSGDPSAPATGFVVETNQDSRRGSAASLIIRNGSLNQGDFIVSGDAFAPIRIMENDRAELIKKASMGTPVRVIGWNKLPNAGLNFVTVKNKKEAEILAESNLEISKEKKDNALNSIKENLSLENEESEKISIPIIIKGDATGTLDAIAHELKKIETEKVKIKLIHQGVGDISEKDAKTAESVKGSIVIGFNVGIDSRAKNIIERSSLEIKIFDIIYKLSDWLTELIKEKTPKVRVVEKHGSFKVLKIFSKDKDRQIIGAKMTEGNVSTGNEVKIMRRENEIGVGKVRELQKQKNRVDEISAGVEFGTMIEAKVVIAIGDIIEPFVIIEK
jgi:translation initiation factor IF-2